MSKSIALAVLLLAAILEAGGDAFMRTAVHSSGTSRRAFFFLVGGLVLFAYGWTVNLPGWDFGRLLGLYVVFVFVVAQIISWLVFGQPASRAVLAGGALIVAGGLVISLSPA